MIATLYAKYHHLVKYGAIGLVNTLADKGTFLLLFNLLHLNGYLSAIIGLHVGILLSFSLNTMLNYHTFDRLGGRFVRFYGINMVGIGLTLSLIYLFSTRMGISVNIVNIAAVVPVFFVMFLLNRRITFRKSDETAL